MREVKARGYDEVLAMPQFKEQKNKFMLWAQNEWTGLLSDELKLDA